MAVMLSIELFSSATCYGRETMAVVNFATSPSIRFLGFVMWALRLSTCVGMAEASWVDYSELMLFAL